MKLNIINLKKFYKNKKVLITGHTGFKGSWLSMCLNIFGAKVYGISLNEKNFKNLTIFKLKDKIKSYNINVENFKNLETKVKKIKPDIIFHLAAQSLVKKSLREPYDTFISNTKGTLNILEIKKRNSFIKSLVIITSDKCYKNLESKHGYNEASELGGDDPYSASKAAAEILIISYLKSFREKFTNTCSARAGNVIGGGDWSEGRIVPDIVRTIFKKKNKIIIRNPDAIRPWQHVLEPISGYIKLGFLNYKYSKKYNTSWNFGPKKKINFTVKKVVESFAKYSEKKIKIIIKKNKNIKETSTLHLSSLKAKKQIKWESQWSHDYAIKQTANWYKAYYNKRINMADFTSKQILEYFKNYI